MILRSVTPPSPGRLPGEEPPASDRPTSALLKADIDSGATGDEVRAYDPGLPQLGTDDGAAANAPSPARRTEAAPARVRRASRPPGVNAWLVSGDGAAIGGVGLVLGLSPWLVR